MLHLGFFLMSVPGPNVVLQYPTRPFSLRFIIGGLWIQTEFSDVGPLYPSILPGGDVRFIHLPKGLRTTFVQASRPELQRDGVGALTPRRDHLTWRDPTQGESILACISIRCRGGGGAAFLGIPEDPSFSNNSASIPG